MKIKSRLGDAKAERTEIYQIKSTTPAFIVEEYQMIAFSLILTSSVKKAAI
ncbi:hypothetical protein [Streptococcus halotolerans]|uniref:hypothetical protein n=1 Tax=Streptococcus halotolerans TaxID=1814128 RepID=UPI000B32F572|nr:hypothetical protein [Streptococcus halotolerans]